MKNIESQKQVLARLRSIESNLKLEASIERVTSKAKPIEVEIDDQITMGTDAVESIKALVSMMGLTGSKETRFMKMLSQVEQNFRDLEAYTNRVLKTQ